MHPKAMQPMPVYKVRSRKDHRAVDLSPMRSHSVSCGTASQTQSVTQSGTQSFSAGQHNAVIRVYDEAGNVIEKHEQA
jgi:hypothetical protein